MGFLDKIFKPKWQHNDLNYEDYDYACKFRQAIESSSEWPPENSKACEIYSEWNENFPDDGNVYIAGVIMGVGNYFIGKNELKQQLNKGQKSKKYDESQSSWLYNLAQKEFNTRFS